MNETLCHFLRSFKVKAHHVRNNIPPPRFPNGLLLLFRCRIYLAAGVVLERRPRQFTATLSAGPRFGPFCTDWLVPPRRRLYSCG